MAAMSQGVVVWLTGLPSSGKTTLARALRDRLPGSALLDGDEVRACLLPSLGYDEAARAAFYESLARLAALLARQGLIVLVPATAPLRAHRELARALAPRFVEVHVAAGVETCADRDDKGLWAAARAGRIHDLPGAGAPYEPPLHPEVVAFGGQDVRAIETVISWATGNRA
jgi:adenylylsulfate kinase